MQPSNTMDPNLYIDSSKNGFSPLPLVYSKFYIPNSRKFSNSFQAQVWKYSSWFLYPNHIQLEVVEPTWRDDPLLNWIGLHLKIVKVQRDAPLPYIHLWLLSQYIPHFHLYTHVPVGPACIACRLPRRTLRLPSWANLVNLKNICKNCIWDISISISRDMCLDTQNPKRKKHSSNYVLILSVCFQKGSGTSDLDLVKLSDWEKLKLQVLFRINVISIWHLIFQSDWNGFCSKEEAV